MGMDFPISAKPAVQCLNCKERREILVDSSAGIRLASSCIKRSQTNADQLQIFTLSPKQVLLLALSSGSNSMRADTVRNALLFKYLLNYKILLQDGFTLHIITVHKAFP